MVRIPNIHANGMRGFQFSGNRTFIWHLEWETPNFDWNLVITHSPYVKDAVSKRMVYSITQIRRSSKVRKSEPVFAKTIPQKNDPLRWLDF